MDLIYSTYKGRFEAITEFSERDIPHGAGMRWDGANKRWFTKNADVAAKLSAYADAVTLRAIDTAKADEAAHSAQAAANIAAAVAASRATDTDAAIPCPVGLEHLGYQKAGIAYAMSRRDTLIADEPGLGKTIQALGVANVMLESRDRLRILVMAPKIALLNWKREAQKWLIKPHTMAIWTASKQPDADVVIVSYDIAAKSKIDDALHAREWDLGVFDEAHALKSQDAARTRAVLGYTRKGQEPQEPIPCKRRLFMTGTPILNRPVELYPVLKAMGVAVSYKAFTAEYWGGFQARFGWDATGASNLPELQELLRSRVMVRRLKADVLTSLPAKRHQIVELAADTPELRRAVAAEDKAAAQADMMAASLKAEIAKAKAAGDDAGFKAAVAALRDGRRAAFTEMSALRHATALAKAPQVVEHLTGLLEGSDESVLVMAHHTDVIETIVAGLAAQGHEAAVITGATPDAARQRAQEDIQSKRKRIFVGSMRACGVAITLTAASVVVFAEQDWVPGIMSQAEDRAHRIGQHNSVLVQHLVLDGSFDCTMAKTVASKGGVILEALDAEFAEEAAPTEVVAEPAEEPAVVAAAPEPELALVLNVVAEPEPATAEVITLPEPEARRRGRPKKDGPTLSQNERTQRWRASKKIGSIEVPESLRLRFRDLRDWAGMDNASLLSALMDAYEMKRAA